LAACGGEPAPTPTPAPTTTTAPTPTLTPTPTPTGPVPAEDDPNWTARQVAAVRMVDAYNEVKKKIVSDPANADLRALLDVAVNPLYEIDRSNAEGNAIRQKRITGWVTPDWRDVGAETVVDGRIEIKVTQCDVDDPAARVIEAGVERAVGGEPRNVYEYIVQWQEDVQDWRVARQTDLETTC
jgi:hypothetical protein